MRQPVDPEKIAQLLKHYINLKRMFDKGKLKVKLKTAMTVLCRQEGISIAIFYRKARLRTAK